MIKYFCDLCGKEIHVERYTVVVYYGVCVDHVHVPCVCPGCASVIMDTISKLRVEES
jgi:hypothetical protein